MACTHYIPLDRLEDVQLTLITRATGWPVAYGRMHERRDLVGLDARLVDWLLEAAAWSSLDDGCFLLRDDCPLRLTARAFEAWEANIAGLHPDDQVLSRRMLEAARPVYLAVLEPATTPDVAPEPEVLGDPSWPYHVLGDTVLDHAAWRANGTLDDGVIVPNPNAAVLPAIAAALFTSFMRPGGIPGFSFCARGVTERVVVRGWQSGEEEPNDPDAFYLLVPESHDAAEAPTAGFRGLPSYAFHDLDVPASVQLVDLCNGAKGWVNPDISAAVLPFGCNADWQPAQSTTLCSYVGELVRKHRQRFPRYMAVTPELLRTTIQSTLEQRTVPRITDYEARIAESRAKCVHFQRQLEATERSVTDLEGVLQRLRTVDLRNETVSQAELLSSLTPIARMTASEDGKILRLETHPIILRTKNWEWLFGRYRIVIGQADHQYRIRDVGIPLAIESLDRKANECPHPHSTGPGSWCFSTALHQFIQAADQADLAALVNIVLAFLQHVNWPDEYAGHLVRFPCRKVGQTTWGTWDSSGGSAAFHWEILETGYWLELSPEAINRLRSRCGLDPQPSAETATPPPQAVPDIFEDTPTPDDDEDPDDDPDNEDPDDDDEEDRP